MRLVFAHVDENYLRALRALFKFTPVSASHVVPIIMPVRAHLLYATLRKTHPANVALITTLTDTACDEGGAEPDANIMHCPLNPLLQSALLSVVRNREHDVVVVQPPLEPRDLHAAVVRAISAAR